MRRESGDEVNRKSEIGNRKSKASHGFTLIEILVAIFIFSIIVTTLFGSFNTVFSSAKFVEESTAAYEMGENCFNRMILDLQALYVVAPPAYKPPDIDDPSDPYRVLGDSYQAGNKSFGRLRFASFAHIPFGGNPQGGIAEIVYYVTTKDDENYVLRRQDHLYPYPDFEENGEDPILCKSIRSLSFTYYDAEGGEFESWDSDSEDVDRATPKAIGIQLVFGNPETPQILETRISLPVYRDKIE